MSALRKNIASQVVTFCLVNATTGAALTGATVTVKVTLDGTQSAGAGTVTELGTGQYKYVPTQGETNGASVGFCFTATNAVPVNLHCFTTALDPASSALDVNVAQISGDATAADNLEAVLDGTGGVLVKMAGLAIEAAGGSGNHAVTFAGDGVGAGLRVLGGANGHGAYFRGGNAGNGEAGIYAYGPVKGTWGAYFKGGGTGPGITPVQGGLGIEGVSDESAALWLVNAYDSMDVMEQLDRYGMITTGTLSIVAPYNAPTGEIKFIRGDIYTTALGRQVVITINGGPNPTGKQCYMYYKATNSSAITSKAVASVASYGSDWTYTFDFTDEETAAISASSTPFEVKVWTATNDDPITVLTGTITMTAPVYDGTGGAVAP